MTVKTLNDHIVSTPGVVDGKPRITGHRITVADIMVWHELMDQSADEIAADYDLSLADVYAALAYYFDHREEIDARMQEDEEFAEALRRQAQAADTQQAHEEPY